MAYGLHVIKNPAGSYSYVGTLPAALGTEVPAKPADVYGGRAYRKSCDHDPTGWKLVTLKFPVFATREEAVSFAESKGFKVAVE